MLITVHLAHPTMPLQIQNEMTEEDARDIEHNLSEGRWQQLTFPPGSPDRVSINPAFVTHVQLVS